MLSVLCLLHSGLPGASQSQPISPVAKPFDSAIAEFKNELSHGRFEKALQAATRAEVLARAAGDLNGEATASLSISECHLGLFQYRAAEELAEAAQQLASRAKNPALAGGAAVELSSIYSQVGDFALAEKEAADSINLIEQSPRPDYLSKALISCTYIQLKRGETAAGIKSSDRAIRIAHDAKLPSIEAMAWDMRGISLLLLGKVPEAETALNRALAIFQQIHDLTYRVATLEHLAELELKKGNYNLALNWLDQAFACPSPLFKLNSQYYPLHVRGQILLGLHRDADALKDFRRAVDAADQWRRGALPGDTTNIQTVAQLQSVYHDYAQLAAELALSHHNPELSREAFEALAENRAASLREQLTLTLSRNSRLPPRYFELLSQLQAAQARVTLGQISPSDSAKLSEIRLELSKLENESSGQILNLFPLHEKSSFQNSLRDIQVRLSRTEVLLSFCLGKRKSFLWAVTGDDVKLYELPAADQIGKTAGQFSDAIRLRRNAAVPAVALSRDLFGKLNSLAWQKRDWLITGDGVLLNGIPFCELPDLSSPRTQPLIATHTVRSLPAELLLVSQASVAPQKRFVGIGDPIYNVADSRRKRLPGLVETSNSKPAIPLGRLPGTEREIRTAAKLSGLPDTQLLVGGKANSTALQNALLKTPEVLHFAVHVVSPEGQPQQAALALSLTKENIPELLTREAIAAYRVPGSLVVLSGCSSNQGEAIPGAGLIGLSRAWLLAGAAAVLVSAWPTPDDSGQFFSAFYGHLQALKTGPLATRAATALQQAQLDMQHGGGYRSSPAFWAAYSIVSKE